MEVIHTGDLHYAAETLAEVEHCMEAVVNAISPTTDAVVIGGDTTDHRLDAHTPAFLALARRVADIARKAPLLLLQGTFSHEPPGMIRLLGLLGERIYVADGIGQVALTHTGRWVRPSNPYAFEEGELRSLHSETPLKGLFSCLPVVNAAAVLAKRGASATAASSNAQAMGDATAAVLAGWAPINAVAAELDIATVGVSHGTARESRTEHGVPMMGMDHEYTTGMLFSAGCSAFMLNHIHLHQWWEVNGRKIAYSGSLPCLHYGEEGEKVFLRWDIGARTASFVATPSGAQRFAHFAFQGIDDIDAVVAELRHADVAGKKVRVRVTLPVTDRDNFSADVIRAALASALEVKVEPIFIPVTRARSEGIGAASTQLERLRVWVTCTGSNAQAMPLETALAQAQNDDVSVIVRGIMQATQPV